MNYFRVIPRDLFNESKLLKCLGRFELIINHQGHRVNARIVTYLEHDSGFDIIQNPNDGSIYCSNYIATVNGEPLHLYTPLNSKESYPLMADFRCETYYVFNDNGNLMTNFGMGEK